MRLKTLAVLFFLFISIGLFGQIEIKPLPKKSAENSRVSQEELPPLQLPFWDDFSTSVLRPDTLWEYSDAVEISASLSSLPPSYNAATIDGINALGQVYDDLDNFSGLTDQLISRRIDLSSLIGDESIYLSFFWEAGGNVERPEDQGDSLRLQFLNTDSVWVTVWKKRAVDVNQYTDFKQEILKVNSAYRHKDFRFKFEGFGSQFGSYDAWHVDYVYVNNGRSNTDTRYLDRTLSGTVSKLVDRYHEMPAEHFFSDPMAFIIDQKVVMGNLTNGPHTAVINYELKNTNTGEIYSTTDGSQSFLSGEIKVVSMSLSPTLAVPAKDPAPDSVVFELMLNSNFNDPSIPVPYKVNDTLRTSYLFHKHYSYDDGTAEFAAGVGQNGSVAIEYVIPVKDTLTHIDIYFPTISPSPVGKTLEVKVWKRLKDNEQPIVSKTITVTEENLDKFTRVPLNSNIVVTDTVYIGYKQKTTAYLPIGLDRGNLEMKGKMYYLRDGNWLQNEKANGIMMIRPVFNDVAATVLESPNFDLTFYPNPTSSSITIKQDHTGIKIWELSGQLILTQPQSTEHDLSELSEGVYILEINTAGGRTTGKLIKR